MSQEKHVVTSSEDSTTPQQFFPGYKTVEDFTKEGFKILVEAIRNSNALPTGRDYDFYRTHDAFKTILSKEGDKIQTMINSILRKNDIEGNIRNRIVADATELIIEANDNMLEKVAGNIDEMNGIRNVSNKPVEMQAVSVELPTNGAWNRAENAKLSISSSVPPVTDSNAGKTIRLLTAKNIVRPQTFFKDKICNDSDKPWEPRIKEKPNSLKPLAIFLEETENGEEYSHPYEYELERFEPADEFLQKEEPIQPKPIEETPLVEVTEPEQLDAMLEELRGVKVIAIDLEHHSYRSFMGITCLMQISTLDKDYLVDTLSLRDKLWILNEVFTKPSILKVFHGADMDIQWLQRDLSLYIVNMFDTHQASKVLEYSGLSLSYLLNRFCNVTPNKYFQLADWRIRPLPEEFKAYAREDTHYLIYVYQKLKQALYERANGKDNLLKSVFQRSTEICLKRYFKPVLREDSYMDFYRKGKRIFDNRQLYALKELYKWRDTISREEDESTGYVLPNHMLLQIAESLPREMQGILACCNPIPPLVKANLLNLHQFILRAREQSLNKPILQEETRSRGQTIKVSKLNMDSPLYCPHDLSKSGEFRDDLPTLLDNNSNPLMELLNKDFDFEKPESELSIFNSSVNDFNKIDEEISEKLQSIKFMGPFERYKMVKPFIQAEEERLAAEKEKADNEKKADEPTDDQRMESIREHFMNLTKQTEADKAEEERSLVEMGGSKKRKHDELEEISHHDAYEQPENTLHTPVPHVTLSGDNIAKRGQKRKASEMEHSPEKQPKGQNKQNNQNRGNKNDKGDKLSKKQKARQNKKEKKKNNYQNVQENFSSFDYSSVDYRQFQGGASGVQNPKDFKSNFKSKGKNRAPNKGFNRAQTFGGNRGGKGRGGGGRGRGR